MAVASPERRVGRQIRMPVSRAFTISLKSIRMRLGRSIITASGVFLGIAFLVSVQAQTVVQWPVSAGDLKPGHVRVDGELALPGDYKIRHGATLADAVAAARGTTSGADLSNVMIVKSDGKRTRVDAARAGAAKQARIASGDSILIPDAATRNRRVWLVVMSLLVCTVGITNAMLMSVTERFKEIGTMKCLGALDRFVVELFIFESSLLGIVASIAGGLVGLASILVVAWATKGWEMVAQVGLLDVLKLLGMGVGVGVVVTLVATIAPAIRAAKLPPAAALRVEV